MVAPKDGLADKLNAKNDDFSLFHTDHVFEQQPFSGDIQRCCVSFVDMVHSTEIIAQISNPARIRKYYSTFINTIAAIARRFNAKIIKNTGDCLIYYFPKTFDYSNPYAFKDVIECGLAMIESHSYFNRTSNKDKLPDINYRVSADYGNVQMNTWIASSTNDLFGPVMNLCGRMNSMASPNGMVIGSNLHQIINRYYADDYDFELLKGRFAIEFCETYHIYTVKNKNNNKSFNRLPNDIQLLQKPLLSIIERQEFNS